MGLMFKIISLLLFTSVSFARTQTPFGIVKKPIGIINNFGSYRAWSDGTFAQTCSQYKNPSSGYTYSGSTGSGMYRIKPSGSSTNYDVYCDMTTLGGVGLQWILHHNFADQTNAPINVAYHATANFYAGVAAAKNTGNFYMTTTGTELTSTYSGLGPFNFNSYFNNGSAYARRDLSGGGILYFNNIDFISNLASGADIIRWLTNLNYNIYIMPTPPYYSCQKTQNCYISSGTIDLWQY